MLMVLVAAYVAYCTVTYVPQIAAEYEKAKAFHPIWGYIYLAVISLVAVAAATLAFWTLGMLIRSSWRRRKRHAGELRNPSQMSRAERTAEIKSRKAEAEALAADAGLPEELRGPIRRELSELANKSQQQVLEIVAFGTVSSGKSSLLNALAGREMFRTDPRGGTTLARSEVPWPGVDRVVLVDTPGLAEVAGREREDLARSAAGNADLVLVVFDGPLKSFEHELVERLAAMEKPIIVCLNKEDWYTPADRQALLDQIASQLGSLVPHENVVAVQASPVARSRVRVLPDGTELEEPVEAQADLTDLSERMLAMVRSGGRDMLLANLLLRSRGLVQSARRRIQAALDQRAEEVVERNMWQAAAAAALSPMPVLDVAAAVAISTKMVVELARVYRQSIDLESAGRLVGELGKNLLGVAGATAATPLVGTAVASLLKTVPGAGTIAGGLLQGLVQALVTRWIGRVFIAYFQSELAEAPRSLSALARDKWDEVTRPAALAELVRTGISRLRGTTE